MIAIKAKWSCMKAICCFHPATLSLITNGPLYPFSSFTWLQILYLGSSVERMDIISCVWEKEREGERMRSWTQLSRLEILVTTADSWEEEGNSDLSSLWANYRWFDHLSRRGKWSTGRKERIAWRSQEEREERRRKRKQLWVSVCVHGTRLMLFNYEWKKITHEMIDDHLITIIVTRYDLCEWAWRKWCGWERERREGEREKREKKHHSRYSQPWWWCMRVHSLYLS